MHGMDGDMKSRDVSLFRKSVRDLLRQQNSQGYFKDFS